MGFAGDRRFNGLRLGGRCRGECLRPCSTFLFTGSKLSFWVFSVFYSTCQRLLWSQQAFSRPPSVPKPLLLWLYRQEESIRCSLWSSISIPDIQLAHNSDIATFPLKLIEWCFGKHQKPKRKEYVFLNLRNYLVGNWRFLDPSFIENFSTTVCKLSIPIANILTTNSPYISVNWRWSSIGSRPFSFKNRITARTSHLSVAFNGSEACAYLFESERSTNQNSVTNSSTNSFFAERWSITFGIALVKT